MRKTFKYTTLVLTFTLLSLSCANKELKTYDYNDVIEKKIRWNEIFFAANIEYFVYIYSNNCGHCNNIKQEIIRFILDDIYPTYLVEFNSNIPISTSIDDTIGVSDYVDVKIKGTPTLLKIENHILTMNIAGENQISTVIDYYTDKF